jgi:hypothetical protein
VTAAGEVDRGLIFAARWQMVVTHITDWLSGLLQLRAASRLFCLVIEILCSVSRSKLLVAVLILLGHQTRQQTACRRCTDVCVPGGSRRTKAHLCHLALNVHDKNWPVTPTTNALQRWWISRAGVDGHGFDNMVKLKCKTCRIFRSRGPDGRELILAPIVGKDGKVHRFIVLDRMDSLPLPREEAETFLRAD